MKGLKHLFFFTSLSLAGCALAPLAPIDYPALTEKDQQTFDECKGLLFADDRNLYHQALPILQQAERLVRERQSRKARMLFHAWQEQNPSVLLKECNQTLRKWEEFYQMRLLSMEKIAKLNWLIQKEQHLKLRHQSGQWLFFPITRMQSLQQTQRQLREELKMLANQAREKRQLFLVNDIDQALKNVGHLTPHQEKTTKESHYLPSSHFSSFPYLAHLQDGQPFTEPFFLNMGCGLTRFLDTPKPPSEKIDKKPPIEKNIVTLETLLTLLDRAIEKGNLPEIQHQLFKIDSYEPLPIETSLKVSAIRHFLKSQMETLDQQADNFYRLGDIEKAQNIWRFLLSLSYNTELTQEKVNRSMKVLLNLEKLRGEKK